MTAGRSSTSSTSSTCSFAAPIIDVIRHTPGASAQSLGRARLFDAQCFADRHPDDFVVLAAFHHVRSEYHKEPTMAGQRRRLDNRKFNVQLHIDGGIHEFEVMWRTDGHLNVHGLTPPYAEWSCNYTFNCDDDPPRFSKGACIYANPGF